LNAYVNPTTGGTPQPLVSFGGRRLCGAQSSFSITCSMQIFFFELILSIVLQRKGCPQLHKSARTSEVSIRTTRVPGRSIVAIAHLFSLRAGI
jgi:hypothetical protein